MRLLSLALLLLAASASGQTRYEWAGGSGNWNEASNWSPAGVPAAADTAAISGFLTVTLAANTTVAGLAMENGSTVAGDVDLTITERFLWDGGSVEGFRGTGTVTVASGATLHLVNASSGARNFAMGTGRTLVNDGTILWEATGRWGGAGPLVNNGEIIPVMGQSDAFGFVFSSLPDALTNTASGVIRRNGTGAALLSGGFVNDGLVRVENGALELNGFNSAGTTGSGAIEVLSGAELRVSGRGASTQASVTGDAVTITSFGNRFTVTDAYDVTTTRIAGSGGGLTLNADATTETLVMENGALDGSGTVTVTGSLTWTGGTMAGSGTTILGPTIPLAIGGDARLSLSDSRTLRAEGPTTWVGDADLSAGTNTTVFENAGTLTSSGPGERLVTFVNFRNTGTVVHDGGTLFFQSPMDNSGEVRIEDGAFKLNSNGTDTGRYTIGDTGQMEFVFGSRTLAASAEIAGTGTVVFTAGTVTNRGLWRPGASPGVLTIGSDLPAPAPEAVLEMEVGGATPGTEHDQLAVTGRAALGGTLRVTLADGFTPSNGDRFLLIDASGGASGQFDAVEIPTTSPEGYVQATTAGVFYGIGTPVASEPSGETLPTVFALHAPAPNPARGRATLGYDLPLASDVRLAVFDALGREIAMVVDAQRTAGMHTATLDARGLPAGVYLVRLDASGERATRALTVLR